MLERLNQVVGVQASASNHAGTLVRVSLTPDADRESTANEVRTVLATNHGRPTRLKGTKLAKVLNTETWRGIDRIGELSAIEFRTVVINRLKAFAKEETLDSDVTATIVKLAEDEWSRLEKEIDARTPPHRADWPGRIRRFAEAFAAKAKDTITADQFERLNLAITSELGQ